MTTSGSENKKENKQQCDIILAGCDCMNYIKDNTLLVIPNNKKNTKLNHLNNEKLVGVKLIDFNELRDNLYFKYDEKAIYYLMNKYNIKYEVAEIYLNNIYYIEEKKYNIESLEKLVKIKEELIEKKLLIYNPYYETYLKTKNIVIYYNNITKYQSKIIEELKKITNVEIYKDNQTQHPLKKCYNFETLEEEVSYVAEEICKLITNNVDIKNIKLLNVTSEYYEIIKRIFTFYHLPVDLNNTTLYETFTSNVFLKTLKESNVIKALEKIIDSELYDQFLAICNKYSWCENPFYLIEHELKQIKLKSSIKGIQTNNITDTNNYYFLLGFNSNYPKTKKDEDYLSDNIKQLLNIDTSFEENKKIKEDTINELKSLPNLLITYKNKTNNSECYPSTLITELNIEIINKSFDYSKYSNKKNKIDLTKSYDLYMKYGTNTNSLKLNSIYKLPYLKYDNSFKGLEQTKLLKKINNELKLSYSSIDNYYKCAFKFYLNNILKLNLDDDTFNRDIGTFFHYILSVCFNDDFNFENEVKENLKNINIKSEKQRFFINKLIKDLEFVVNTIKEQMKYISLDKSLYEQKIYLNFDNNIKVTFSGIIDKVLYKEHNGYKYGIIIDYKTGNPSTNIDNIENGINLQLPIYLYLLEENYKDIKIVGLYYQKLLQGIPSREKDYYKQKQDALKLIGYTYDSEDIINLIDNNYEDSNLIKGMKKSKNGFYSYTKLLNDNKLQEIKTIADKKINESIENILDCNFKINPKKINKESTCKNCIYVNICYKEEKDYIYIDTKGSEENEVD